MNQLVAPLYGLAHFGVDFACAYVAFSTAGWSAMDFLLYNFCAFALQMPLGLLTDHLRNGRKMALWGGLLVIPACLLPIPARTVAILSGLGNAMFHVGAGHRVLTISERGKIAPLGVFVSPGAIGIGLGRLAAGRTEVGAFVALLVLIVSLIPYMICRRSGSAKSAPARLPERKAFLLPALLLFLVVVLRSVGGMAAPSGWKSGGWALPAIFAAASGKAAGGFLADRSGRRKTGLLSLGAAAACYLLCDMHPMFGVLGVFTFQMTMPITLFEMAERMPRCKAFSFGLLTFGLFIGFLPVWFGMRPLTGAETALTALLSGGLLLLALRGDSAKGGVA